MFYDINFECPKCHKKTELEKTSSGNFVAIIKEIDVSQENVILEEEITEIYEEHPEYIQCSKCGFVLRDENRNCIVIPEDLHQYLKSKNMLQRKMDEAQILKNIYDFIQNADGDEIARVFEQIMGEKCYYDGLEYIHYPKES